MKDAAIFVRSEESTTAAREGFEEMKHRPDRPSSRSKVRGFVCSRSLFQLKVLRFVGCSAWVDISEDKGVDLFAHRPSISGTTLITTPIVVEDPVATATGIRDWTCPGPGGMPNVRITMGYPLCCVMREGFTSPDAQGDLLVACEVVLRMSW